MLRTISHYRVIERLGSGGMGDVYKAEDLKLNRTVALKMLSYEMVADSRSQQFLMEEAKRAATINHPHIATVYELGQNDGQSYIAMEYVEGETLTRFLEDGPFEITTAIDIAIQMADALKAAHSHDLIHCDIKSSNVMLARDGAVKVLDFGLARAAPKPDDATRAERLPSSDAAIFAGTASYMSPEQVRGEPLDARTDIFSLGVVLYEMLTARRPFEANGSGNAFASVTSEEPPPLSAFCGDAPLELEGITRRALEKNRSERYSSAEELLSDLEKLRDRIKRLTAASQSSDSIAVDEGDIINGPNHAAMVHAAPSRWQLSGARYQNWVLVASVIAAILAVYLYLYHHDGSLTRISVLLLTAMASFTAYAILRRKPTKSFQSLSAASAFRGLLPFQEADRNRFYGREMETSALFDMIAHSDFRFGILYGESGSGKTSLVRAGLVPKLWEEGYTPVYCRSYKDPLAAVVEECRRQSRVSPIEGEPPVDYIRRVAEELNSITVIICDQFEEFFVNFKSRSEREPFTSMVAACHNDSDLAVKFLFSMRSDFLFLIGSEFDGLIDEPLASSSRYHLRNFDAQQAEEIIKKSALSANLPLEAGLSHQVARDLASGGTVLPSELQIVGERLQTRRIHTLQAYRRAGGKESLVHNFLEEVIEATGDKEGAQMLLRCLISDENTKLTLPLAEIAKRTQRDIHTVERLLRLFAKSRLVREIQEENPWRYELMHEYLIEKINQITGRVMDATQRANRLLRQYLSDYSVDKRSRIPLVKVLFIRRYSDLERDERARELLKKSLRWGLVKLSAIALMLMMGTTIAAAMLSVNEEWEMVRLSDGHTAAARQVAFSPDGRLLVSVGEDSKVIVWDFARRERLATFTDHSGWVHAVAFSPDGKWFASASADKTVIVWDAARLEKAAVLRGHQEWVNSVAFSPDGKFLASIAGQSEKLDRTILWSVGEWKIIRELPVSLTWGDIVFSPDGRNLLVGTQIWNLTTGDLADELENQANWIALSQDTRMGATVSSRGNVSFLDLSRYWDQAEGKSLGSYFVHRFFGRSVTFSPDGRFLASAAEDIILWDTATRTRLARLGHSAEVWRVAFSPDGRWLVSSHADGAILLWDVAEHEAVANLNEHHASVRSAVFSKDGKWIASASEDRSIIIWNAESGQKEAVLIGHETRVTAVDFSPDGKSVASCDQDGAIIYWNLAERRLRWKSKYQTIKKEMYTSFCLTFSPDGRFIATTHGIYSSDDGRLMVDFLNSFTDKIPSGSFYALDFSADGRWLACAHEAGFLFLFDMVSQQFSDSAEVNGVNIIAVSFSPDGKHIITGEDQGAMRLWEINPLRQTAILGHHAARIKSVAFSPDGREVASASDDQTIALWDVKGQRLVTNIGTHSAPIISVAFSPDGNHILSGEHDKSVRIYTRHRTLWSYRLD